MKDQEYSDLLKNLEPDKKRFDFLTANGMKDTSAAWRICQLEAMIDALVNHCGRESGECEICSIIVCPMHCDMHLHHDGCPACSTPITDAE